MKIRTNIKAGGIEVTNHYEKLVSNKSKGLIVKTRVIEQNQSIARTGLEIRQKINESVEEFKNLMYQAAQESIKNTVISAETIQALKMTFNDFFALTHQTIGTLSLENQYIKDQLGSWLQREFLPYILLGEFSERVYTKPRGYAGDFYTIELMYTSSGRGIRRLGELMDHLMLETSAAKAVKNRRPLLKKAILEVIEARNGETTNVTSLACGPAAELFDAFETLSNQSLLKATCLDMDSQALAFVSDKSDNYGLQDHINLVNANLVHLALGRTTMQLHDQDFVYSIGLIDYFKDELVVKLLDWVYDILRPGGRVVLGNFHAKNRLKVFMDYVLDWRLIHRTESDMNRLYQMSKFNRPCTNIQFEEEGINLFAECVKE